MPVTINKKLLSGAFLLYPKQKHNIDKLRQKSCIATIKQFFCKLYFPQQSFFSFLLFQPERGQRQQLCKIFGKIIDISIKVC